MARYLWRSLVIALAAQAACVPASAAPPPAPAPKSEDEALQAMRSLPWQKGPTKAVLGSKATIPVPDGTAFLKEADGSRFLELTGNLPTSGVSILSGRGWWSTFEFDPVGFVKDDEKIDAAALLKELKESDGPGNEERKKRGLPELHTDGWYVEPHYDSASKRLEWGLRLHASNDPDPVINYTVRILGRTGYERVVLVSSPERLDGDVKAFKAVLKDFDFNSGEKYSEFKAGDHVAEIGLAALVVGGATAVAVKTGFWKVLLAFLAASWKLVAGAAVVVVAGVGKLFKKKQA